VDEALESINPFSEENCAYQGTKAIVEAVGGDAAAISTAAGVAAGVLGSLAVAVPAIAPVAAPLAGALAVVSSAAGAYASGQEAARGETLAAALDALGGVLGGTAAAERFLSDLESQVPDLVSEGVAERTRALAEILDRLGYGTLAASILNSLVPNQETPVDLPEENC
jgi:hypothetical protein